MQSVHNEVQHCLNDHDVREAQFDGDWDEAESSLLKSTKLRTDRIWFNNFTSHAMVIKFFFISLQQQVQLLVERAP